MYLLMPRTRYGIVLYGNNIKNLIKLNRLFNTAIGIAIKKNYFDRYRVYEESDINRIEVLDKYYRAKNFFRWKESSIKSSELIENEIYIENRRNKKILNRTWINTIHEFINKNK